MKKINCIFLGTPEFSIPVLETLNCHPLVNLVEVVTMPDRPVGRGQKMASPAIAKCCQDKKINFYQTSNVNTDEELMKRIKSSEIDIVIVFAFSQFLSNDFLKLPKIGCFNIHTSLLPKYRGSSPIQYALLNGDKLTGVSLQKMVKKMDAGDIVKSLEVEVYDYDDLSSLSSKLKSKSAELIHQFIDDLYHNNLTYSPQDPSGVSFAPLIKKEDGLLDFFNDDAKTLVNKARAFHPWPGTHCYLNGEILKVLRVEIFEEHKTLLPGAIDISSNQLIVGTKNGCLRLMTVQKKGKKPCSDIEFLNGHKNKYNKFEITQD
jgi:methionyl-tRNA formyltransferase